MNRREGFTLIELLVVVAVIALIITILLPSLRAARHQARATMCMSNCKEIGLATQMYAMQFNDKFPPSAHGGGADPKEWWLHVLTRYSKAPLLFRCPEDQSDRFLDWSKALPGDSELDQYRWASYAVNYLMVRHLDENNESVRPYSDHLSGVHRQQYTVLVAESQDSLKGVDHIHPERFDWTGGPEGQVAAKRHTGKANYLFVDAHVERLRIEQTWKEEHRNLWDPAYAPGWHDDSTPPPPSP